MVCALSSVSASNRSRLLVLFGLKSISFARSFWPHVDRGQVEAAADATDGCVARSPPYNERSAPYDELSCAVHARSAARSTAYNEL